MLVCSKIEAVTKKMTNMDISTWGPRAWTFLHCVTFAYPEFPTPEDRRRAHGFFAHLAPVLPCKVCARHLGEHMRAMSPASRAFDSREALAWWLYGVHDEVNSRMGKARPSFASVRKAYAPVGEAGRTWAQMSAAEQVPVLTLLTLGALAVASVAIGARCRAAARCRACAKP